MYIVLITVFFIFIIYRTLVVFYNLKTKKQVHVHGKSIKSLIFLGSGGHTSEMVKIVQNLNFDHYASRHYVVASTDTISANKIEQIEKKKDLNSDYYVHIIPRSREVGQSWFTTIFSTFYSFIFSFYIVLKIKPNLVLCNGPGSCVPICISAFILKILYLNVKIIFIESICRVKTLSLSGKILYYFCDDFFVQWPHLYRKFPGSKYLGRTF
ncbi:UNVERIFIED_CONTAM: hypothetical protein RMT77_001054 [Armadillidium vulgare]